MNQKDIKLLWGRAANRCSICRQEVSQDSKSASAAFPLGEQAHIVAETSGGPRGKSLLTVDERNSYHHIILLCPNHHTEVDKNLVDWPIEKLHLAKSAHELWVRETLAEATDQRRLANQVAVTYVIDSAVELCSLENWKSWTQWALNADPRWHHEQPERAFEFRQRASAAIWPQEFDELRRATLTLAITLNAAALNFKKHSTYDHPWYLPEKFYKSGGFNKNYDADLDRYNKWIDEGYQLIYKSTAAANWFADVVRRDINPMFFAKTGKFVIVEGPFLDLTVHARIFEFTDEQKKTYPEALGDIEA